jgi:hypothetical protein
MDIADVGAVEDDCDERQWDKALANAFAPVTRLYSIHSSVSGYDQRAFSQTCAVFLSRASLVNMQKFSH